MNTHNYFFISFEKELKDSLDLCKIISDSNWIDSDTVIVNCSPDYSSKLTQLLNHKLSYLNNNDLFECIDLQMPYPNMNQVWDDYDRMYKNYTLYLLDWIRRYINTDKKYLFVDSGTLRGKNFTSLRYALKGKLELNNFKFASLYLQLDSIFTPDFYMEKFDKDKRGGLLFEWENINNPNWNY